LIVCCVLTLRDVDVGAFDFSAVAKNIGHPLPFVLGDEVFNELAVEIDFQHRRIAFRDPATVTKPAGASEVPLIRIKDRTVPVSIDGATPVPFEFDLGDGSPLDVAPSYYQARQLLNGRRTSQTVAGGVGGYRPETVASLRDVGFAGVDFADVPANFTADVASADNSNLIMGTIGLPMLARFRLIVDYSHDRLFATPTADASNAPFSRDRLGLYLDRKGAVLVVGFVAPGSPAKTAGFKIGDVIARIDNVRSGEKPIDLNQIDQPSTSAWSETTFRALRDEPVGTVVTFTLANGSKKRVELADFY